VQVTPQNFLHDSILILPNGHFAQPDYRFSLPLHPMIGETRQLSTLFPPADINQLLDMLAEPRNIVITTHRNPDGDAMGSSLGWARILSALGHTPTVIIPNAFDNYLSWLPGIGEVIDATGKPHLARKRVEAAELIFCLDFGAWKRIGDFAAVINSSKAPKIMVDHHIDPEDFGAVRFHVVGISSTAELIYRMAMQMGLTQLVDTETAECLYVGLMTDTGSFRFDTTTPEVHRIAAGLLDKGINVGRIHNLLFDNFSEQRTRFLGYLLHEKMVVLPEYKTAYMTITMKEVHDFNIGLGDTEGFVNYNLSLRGINFGILMKEGAEGTRISFRSIGSFPCNEFAAHFGGGGHHNASGGRVDLSLAETEAKILALLPEFKDQLQYES
jgi:phosphoesterase RecJ-like protein